MYTRLFHTSLFWHTPAAACSWVILLGFTTTSSASTTHHSAHAPPRPLTIRSIFWRPNTEWPTLTFRTWIYIYVYIMSYVYVICMSYIYMRFRCCLSRRVIKYIQVKSCIHGVQIQSDPPRHSAPEFIYIYIYNVMCICHMYMSYICMRVRCYLWRRVII